MSTARARSVWQTERGVSYREYVRRRLSPRYRGLKMNYFDGLLETMSPEYLHESAASRFEAIIREVLIAFDIEGLCSRQTTFRLGGRELRQGHGREPDTSFYVANADAVRNKDNINLNVDPPPDLWVEVDNRGSSSGRRRTYAALRIPELWRYRVRSGRLALYRLADDDAYVEIDRSLALPMLATADILAALADAADGRETRWAVWLRETWAPSLRRERP